MKAARIVEGGRFKGYDLDPARYLAQLAVIAQNLPAGARQFATDPGHYDFGSARCVKDLALVSTLDADGGTLSLCFDPNVWKHDRGLRVTYRGVQAYDFQPNETDEGFGTVMLDELLPSGLGMTHEFFMTGGTLRVEAEDLDAQWNV